MKVLPVNASDEEILAFCWGWVDLVAVGRFAEAIELLYVPTTYDQSQHWTPESLETYVANFGSWEPLADGRQVRITEPVTARTPVDRPALRPRAEVVRLTHDPTEGSIELDVPLDGEWSDLTAQFEFAPVGGGIGISLYDLHVL